MTRLALVGDEQRVDAEHLSGGAHLRAHRDGLFLEDDADPGLVRHLVEHRGEAAAGRVLHGDHVLAAGRERGPDEAVDGRDVGAQVALERAGRAGAS